MCSKGMHAYTRTMTTMTKSSLALTGLLALPAPGCRSSHDKEWKNPGIWVASSSEGAPLWEPCHRWGWQAWHSPRVRSGRGYLSVTLPDGNAQVVFLPLHRCILRMQMEISQWS